MPIQTPIVSPANAAVVNGNIEIDGVPFFPFGFWHVTHNSGGDADLLTALDLIAAAGFSAMSTSIRGGPLDYGAFLDLAASKNVRIITDFGQDPPYFATLITAHSAKLAVLGWQIADDVDDGTKVHANIEALYDQGKADDPRHLVLLNGFRAPFEGGVTIAAFMDVADVTGMQRYPVSASSVNLVYQADSATVDAAAAFGPQPVLAHNQSFNWNDSRGNRYPTAAEGRNMTYQSIAAGCKGIQYYTWFDLFNPPLPTSSPSLWAELQSLVPEMDVLAPVILTGALTRVLSDQAGDRFASYWTYQNSVYVVAINTSATTAKSFSLTMPTGPTALGPAQSLFAGRPSGLTFSAGVLSGTVQAHDVHVYVLVFEETVPVVAAGTIGVVDPGLRQQALFDTAGLIPEGWFDADLITTEALAGPLGSYDAEIWQPALFDTVLIPIGLFSDDLIPSGVASAEDSGQPSTRRMGGIPGGRQIAPAGGGSAW